MKDELLFYGNFFVSKSMKHIDSIVGFSKDVEKRLVKNLIDCNKDKTKEFDLNKNEDNALKKRIKEEKLRKIENSKINKHQLNIISSPYNMNFLPRISPYIKNIDNHLIMDYKKANKLGSKGFQYIWKQEYLRKLSDNKTNKKSKKKQRRSENINYDDEDDDEEELDIFNIKYVKENNKCDEYIELKKRLDRIINENKKVKKKFDFRRELSLKFKVKKIYNPKYESIERRQPEVSLNNQTKRIFPDKFIQKSYYSENNNKLFSKTFNINNKSIKNKMNNNTLNKNKKKIFYICSTFSLDNIFNQNKKNNYNRNIYKTSNLN